MSDIANSGVACNDDKSDVCISVYNRNHVYIIVYVIIALIRLKYVGTKSFYLIGFYLSNIQGTKEGTLYTHII